ncbi:MAG TPA: hypothetical protein VFJ55_06885 [Chthoniobacterales bacterium]|nr:hypothetical protein [Chthoniobacterales bacterium]
MDEPAPPPIRRTGALVRTLVVTGLGLLGLVTLIFFKQHSVIYHPRPHHPYATIEGNPRRDSF